MLAELGLTPVAEKVYLALSYEQFHSVARLAQHIDLTELETKKGLKLLYDFGISSSANSDAVVVSPSRVVQILLDKQESGLHELEALLERSQKIASSFINKYELNIDNAENERVFGIERILKRLSELAASTKRQVHTFAPKAPPTKAALEASKKANREILSRGVRSQTIYLDSATKDPHTITHLNWLIEHGSQVRTSPVLPIRMIIFDNKVAVLPLNLADAMEGMLVVHNPGNIQALSALFELTWLQSRPYGTKENIPIEGLSANDQIVLSKLTQGKTDPQIATEMGLTERQVRYITNSLMGRLGARTKFEFGALAAQEGWLATL